MISYTFVLLLTLLLPIRCIGSRDCDSYTDCKTCTNEKSWFRSCRWCPGENKCHTFASPKNTCEADENIVSPSDCSTGKRNFVNNKAYGVYNPNMAYTATLLSAISYSDTPAACLNNILPDTEFEPIHGIGRRCEDLPLFEYKECYAYTAVSNTRKLIVLAHRGTTTSNGKQQLYDQIVSVLTTPKTPFIAGGEVQYYFENAYNKLFPCVRSSIEELVKMYPDYEVLVTGHSLGGAIASLTAASLIHNGIVPENKLSLYTFGMPRAGDKEFALNHDRIVKNSWRVVHSRDIVAHIPPCNFARGCGETADGPYHHRTEIFYPNDHMTKDSYYKQCDGNENELCSNGLLKDNWCVPFVDMSDCIDFHKNYFDISVGTYCEEKCNRRKRSASDFSLMWDKFENDKCRKIDLSGNHSKSCAFAKSEKSTTTNVASLYEQSRLRIAFILMSFTIFKYVCM